MTIESFLTRELDIRFIDARSIATEAKINLGIHGYPTKDQQEAIQEEACRIFNSQPHDAQYAMRQLSADLQAAKFSSCGMSDAGSSCGNDDAGSFAESDELSSSYRSTSSRSSLKSMIVGRRRWMFLEELNTGGTNIFE